MSEYIYEEVITEKKDCGAYVSKTVMLDGPRERIVRCRDCAAYDKRFMMCMKGEAPHWIVGESGFCAWGMRRYG